MTPKGCGGCAELAARLQEREQMIQELGVDAARYRWLRTQNGSDAVLRVARYPSESIKLGYDYPTMDRLDRAIDAAIKK